MKKVLVTGLAVLAAVGISVPVIASGIQRDGAGTENIVESTDDVLLQESAIALCSASTVTAELKTWAAKQAPKAEIKKTITTESKAEEVLQTDAVTADVIKAEAGTTTAHGNCSYWVDANGDGICDHCVGGTAGCGSYVDTNGDGLCDHCVGGSGYGTCGSYVDANGDGICDHCVGGSSHGSCSYWVDANGDGVCDHCAGGSSHGSCSYWVDANGDGICDHCVGGSSSGSQNQGSSGSGHHGGRHHGGRHH